MKKRESLKRSGNRSGKSATERAPRKSSPSLGNGADGATRLAAKKAGTNEEWWGAGPDTLARSKRLILAAIKVWELKQQRISETGARLD